MRLSLRRRALASLATVIGISVFAQTAQAVDYIWGNVGTDFNTAANWTPLGVPGTLPADTAIFDVAATMQPNLSTDALINYLRFSTAASSGYTLSASPGAELTLTSTGATSTVGATHAALVGLNTTLTNTISAPIILGAAANSTQTFVQASAGTMVLSGPISEANSNIKLQFAGNGSFLVSEANSYTGDTSIGIAGTGLTKVRISNAAAFGTTPSTISIQSNGASNSPTSELSLTGGITVAANKTLSITGSGNISFRNTSGSNTWAGPINATTVLVRINSDGTAPGDKLTLSGPIAIQASGANGIVLGGPGLIEVSGVISSVAGGTLTKSSNAQGTLILSGANTYSGVTSISNGTVSVASLNSVATPAASSNLGRPTTVANGTINLGSNSTGTNAILKYTGTGETTDRVINLATDGTSKPAQIDQSGSGLLKFTSNFSSNVAGAKTLTLLGSTAGVGEIAGALPNSVGAGNALSINKLGSGTWVLSGNNTNSGAVTVAAGTLQAANANALGFGSFSSIGSTSAGTNVTAGATLDIAGQTVNEIITLNGTGLGGNGALINSSASPTTISSGLASLALTAGGSGYSTVPTVTVDSGSATAAATLGVTGDSFTISGTTVYTVAPTVAITGGGGSGATGTAILTGGVVTGVTITNAGTGYTTAPTIAFTGGTVGTAGTNPTGVGNATNFTVSGVRLTSAGAGYTTLPTISFDAGTTTATATANRTGVVLASDSSIGGVGNITIDSAVTGGAFALTKVGSNTVNLNGANTYTGVTTVSTGRLDINGSITSATTVAAAGTLGGIGSITGNLTSDGTVAPGNSIGTLTVIGDATFNAGSSFQAELGAANSSDLLNLTSGGSNLSLASNTDTLNLLSTLDPGTFTIIDYNGTRAGGIFDLVSFNSLPQTLLTSSLGVTNPLGFSGTGDLYNYGAVSLFYNDSATSVQVGFAVIPEPSTLVLGGLALLGFAGMGLRKRRLAANRITDAS